MNIIYIKFFNNKLTIDSPKIQGISIDDDFLYTNDYIHTEKENVIKHILKAIKNYKMTGPILKPIFIVQLKNENRNINDEEKKSLLEIAYYSGARETYIHSGKDLKINEIDKTYIKTLKINEVNYN